MSILNKIKSTDLDEFVNICAQFIEFDTEKAKQIATAAIKYYRGDKQTRQQLVHFQDLENRWYNSLDKSKADYSVYSDKYILFDIWACWVIYSRNYLKKISDKKSLFEKSIVDDIGEVGSILDLGCGFGYTTAALKEIWPNARVFGTNIEGSDQYRICKLFSFLFDFHILPDHAKLSKVDLIFASEYFEHIENSVEHLEDIIERLHPKYLIVANTFSAKSIGHFNMYKYQDRFYPGRRTSRIFNDRLRMFGFEKVKTNLWNDRPAYFRKYVR